MRSILLSSIVLLTAVAICFRWHNFTGFTLEEATITSLHKALFRGQKTCLQVVEEYISRIQKYDNQLNSIVLIHPNATRVAEELDALTNSQQRALPLFCVPILVKDNIDVAGIPTTAGSKAMANCTPTQDAFIISKLRQAGAIILAKNHLNEFAFQGISRSSLGGQVYNPYNLSHTPGGSSGGTAAAIAANFGMVGLGTDTMNSVRSPASACSCVGFRGSKGLVSRGGEIGVSFTQDVIGPIARTTEDLRKVFDVISGFWDENDNVTAMATVYREEKIKRGKGLKGLRLGVLTSYINHTLDATSHHVSTLFHKTLTSLSTAAVHLTYLTAPPEFHPLNLSHAEVSLYEVQSSFNKYLTSPTHHTCPSSFQEIYTSGLVDEIAVGPTWHISARQEMSPSNPEYYIRLSRIETLKLLLAQVFAENKLDGLIFPHQTILVVRVGATFQAGRNGLLTSLTGAPGGVVPMGFSSDEESEDGGMGIPIGMEVVGLWGWDWHVLGIMEEIEVLLKARRAPFLSAKE